MAKVDFWQGEADEDFGNIPYAILITSCVQLRRHPKIKTVDWKHHSLGTWFEAMVGIAYSVATSQANLRGRVCRPETGERNREDGAAS